MTHHTTEVNGIRFHYVRSGEGESVILLHGFLGTWYTWRRVIPALAARYTVVAPDLRGYGDSDKPYTGYDAATLAEDIRDLVQALGLRPVSLVAHDMGAPPALLYAASYPNEVRKLAYLEEPVLGINSDELTRFAPPTGGAWWWPFAYVPDLPEALIAGKERDFLTYFYRRFSYDPTTIDPDTVDEYLRTFAAPGGVRGSLGVYRDVFKSTAQTREATKQKLTLPVLALGGSSVSGEAVHKAMQRVADDVRGGVVENCGHFLPEECPDALLGHLLPFLAE